ncbi:MAG: DUF1254 domain-containing protein [Bdellovibrio sp.]|nr:DUF1254 domain-containing protein [Bdellovibrio sp.]
MRAALKLTTALGLAVSLSSCASSKEATGRAGTPAEVQSVTEQAYIYAYPLVLMGVTRDVMTAVPRTSQNKAPLNQIANRRTLPDDRAAENIFPNVDTLSSMSWLDLSKGPVVLSIPEAGSRFYMLPLMSAWTNVIASPGSRTTGNHKGDFAITGPNWQGTLPANVVQIKSPTNSVWMIGRTKATKNDLDQVYAFQDRLKITPLNDYGKNVSPSMSVPFDLDVDTRTAPGEQVDNMDARTFFTYFAQALKENPPAASDSKMVARLSSMGIVPGKDFIYDKLTQEQQRALNIGYFAAQEKIAEALRSRENLDVHNGWRYPKTVGTYGDDYMARALIAKVALGANIKQDAIFPLAKIDQNGVPLNGGTRYVIRFAKGKLPPVNGFWSLTMYNSRQFLVKNPINRFAIGDRDKLKYNRDGSLDIYIQAAPPGKDKEANWLPAPDGEDFNLAMRLYWPKQAALDGSWKVPAVEKVQEIRSLSDNQNLR